MMDDGGDGKKGEKERGTKERVEVEVEMRGQAFSRKRVRREKNQQQHEKENQQLIFKNSMSHNKTTTLVRFAVGDKGRGRGRRRGLRDGSSRRKRREGRWKKSLLLRRP